MKAKRFLATLLCLLMMASLFPTSALAGDRPDPAGLMDAAGETGAGTDEEPANEAEEDPATEPDAEPMAEPARGLRSTDMTVFAAATSCTVDLYLDPGSEAGTVSVSPASGWTVGQEITLTATAYSGYTFMWWVNYDTGENSTSSTYTTTLTGDCEWDAVFRKNGEYFIYISKPWVENDPSQTLQVSPDAPSYASGTPITLNAPAKSGRSVVYEYGRDVEGNSSSVTSWTRIGGNSFSMPAYDVWVRGLYSVNLTLNTGAHGTATLSPSSGPYYEGDTVTLTVNPDSGYRAVISGIPAGYTVSGDTYTFTMGESDLTISVEFEALPAISLAVRAYPDDAAGSASISQNETNGEVTLTATPKDGYHFLGWYDVGSSSFISQANPYTFEPTQSMTIFAYYYVSVYKANVEHGTLEIVDEKQAYAADDVVTLKGTPDEGYVLDYYLAGKLEGSSANLEPLEGDSFTMPAYDMAVGVRFAKLHTISALASPNEGGTVTGAGQYKDGTVVTLTATANSGYSFVNWTENGAEVSADATYSFTASANRTLMANFELIPATKYTIGVSASPTEGGTVTGAGEYESGATITLTAMANSGYHFVNWTENGAEVSADTAYTFTADRDRTLIANFQDDTAVISYPLWVGGVQVTSANKGDILGDGTASFDPDSSTLTLTNANITAASTNTHSGGATYNNVVYARGLDLTVSLSGDNTVGDGSAYYAIMSDKGTLAITGGSLTAAGSGLALYAENGISITGSTVIAEGGTTDGIFTDRAVTITDSTVTATGSRYGICAVMSSITISGNSVVTASGGRMALRTTNGGGVTLNDGLGYIEGEATAKKAVIAKPVTAYPLWVGGVQVTDANKGDILGNGTAKYEGDATGGTLTLTNANITGSAIQDGGYQTANILIGNADHSMNVTVQVEGVNTLSGASNGIDGWECGKLTLTGSGTLNASGSVSGINSNSAMEINGPTVVAETTGNYYGFGLWTYELTIRGGSTVTAKGDGVGICCIEGSLKVRENSSVTAEGGDKAISSKGGITLDGVVIRETDPTGGEIGNCWDGYKTITTVLVDGTPVKKVVIDKPVTAYPLWVGGVQVTDANKGDILGDGTASFDPDSNTLTLTNANITAASTNTHSSGVTSSNVVYARGLDLTVSLSGDNTLGDDSADHAIMSDEGSLAIMGSGSLTAVSGNNTAIHSTDYSISIAGSTVTATSSGVDGIFADRSVTITDSTVTASGSRYGICAVMSSITISGADSVVTASGGRMALRTTNGGGVTLNDGLGYIEGEATAKKAVIGLPIYTVTVVGGTADKATAKAGETVTITADAPQAGYAFNQWALVDGVDFDNASAAETTFTMPAKDVTVTAVFPEILLPAISDQTYTGEAIEPTFGLFDVRLDGVDGIFVKGTHYDLSYSDNVDAGTASVTLTMLAPRTGSKSVTFRILPADFIAVEVSAIPNQVYTGGAIEPEPTVTWNGKTLVKGTDYTLSYENNTDAGTATVTLTGCGNFTGTKTATFEITQKPLTVTAEAKSKTYGEADPALTYTVSGLVDGDTITGELTRAAGENVGSYVISQGTLTAGDNYTITFTGAELAIGAKALTITAEAKTKTYGEADPALTYTVSGLVDGNTISGELTRAAGENVGSYAISQGTLTAGNNYTITFTGAELTIEKAAITIMAADKSSQYGKDIVELTYAVGGAYKTGDDLGVTVTTTATRTSDVGEYPITVSWNENPNYSATLVNGKYTITKTDLTVSAAGYSGMYDKAVHGITVDVGSSDAVVYYAQTELTDENYATAGSTTNPTYTDAGKYTVYFYVVSGNYVPDKVSGSKTVIITAASGTADETQGETPTARTGLAYTGEPQVLVTAPTNLPEGYDKVQYSLDGGTTWTDSLPTGTDAGDYTVSVRYLGDKNHEDFSIASIPVTIKATWTVKYEMGGAAAIDDQTVVDGEKPVKPADPVRDGYTFDGWYADADFKTVFDFSAAITADTTVYAKWTAIGYAVTAITGTTADSSHTWRKGSTTPVVITVKPVAGEDHSFAHFVGVDLDGRTLVLEADYTAHEGSTVVTLKPAMLEKNSLGDHTVTILFDNGKVDVRLTIKAAPTSPATGDDRVTGLWAVLTILSAMGMGGVTVFVKKRRYSGKH